MLKDKQNRSTWSRVMISQTLGPSGPCWEGSVSKLFLVLYNAKNIYSEVFGVKKSIGGIGFLLSSIL